MRNYTFQTPEHSFDFIPDPLDDKRIRVASEYRDSIEDFLKTVELSGRADDADFASLSIQEDISEYTGPYFYVEVTRDDLAVYLEFEVRYFMGVEAK